MNGKYADEIKSLERHARSLGVEPEEFAMRNLASIAHNLESFRRTFKLDPDKLPLEALDVSFEEPYVQSLIEADRRGNLRRGKSAARQLAKILPELWNLVSLDLVALKKKTSEENISTTDDNWLESYLSKIDVKIYYDFDDMDISFCGKARATPTVSINKTFNTLIEQFISPLIANVLMVKESEASFKFAQNVSEDTISQFSALLKRIIDGHINPEKSDLYVRDGELLQENPLNLIIFSGIKEFILLHEYSHYIMSLTERKISYLEEEINSDMLAVNAFVHQCLSDELLKGMPEFLLVKLTSPLILMHYILALNIRVGYTPPQNYPSPLARCMYLLHIIANAIYKEEDFPYKFFTIFRNIQFMFINAHEELGEPIEPNDLISPKDVLHDYPFVCYPPGWVPMVFSMANPDVDPNIDNEVQSKTKVFIENALKMRFESMGKGDSYKISMLNKSVIHKFITKALKNK